MSFLGAFPGASEPRASFSSKSSQSSSSITGKHFVAFRASSPRHHILSVWHTARSNVLPIAPSVTLGPELCGLSCNRLQEGCFLLRLTNSTGLIYSYIVSGKSINQGQSHLSRQIKAIDCCSVCKWTQNGEKCFRLMMAERQTTEAVWELSECFNNFT